jgi:multidrug resistance protein, MATE family
MISSSNPKLKTNHHLKPYRIHFKESLKLAVPVMLGNLGHIMMNVCDMMMVGHLGANSLAGAGLATVVFNVFLLFGVGVALAITPLVAEAHGENNAGEVSATLKNGLLINVLNAVFLISIVMTGKNLLNHLQQSEEVIEQSFPYLNIITFSLFPVLVYQSFKQFAEGLSNTLLALMVVLACNVLNIVLNYILIYGHLGFPAYGLPGAGYATLISRIVMATAMALIVYHHHTFRQYREAFAIGAYSKKLIKKILHLGVPSGAQYIFEVAAFDFSLVMMGWLGPKQQAAHQIVINVATLSYMITAGLAAAATVRVGTFLGRQDFGNMRRAAYSILIMGLLLMSFFAAIFLTARNFIPALYIQDAEVIRIASGLLIIAALFQLSDGTQVICNATLRGLQDVKVPSVFIFIAYWIIGLPLGYLLAFKNGFGPQGIWIGLLAGLTVTAVSMYFRLKNQLKNPIV